jgi:hypothetical protein
MFRSLARPVAVLGIAAALGVSGTAAAAPGAHRQGPDSGGGCGIPVGLDFGMDQWSAQVLAGGRVLHS